jgi:hypothetical protein
MIECAPMIMARPPRCAPFYGDLPDGDLLSV